MKLYEDKLKRDFNSTDENTRIYEAYLKVLNPPLSEDATANAKKTLDAIVGMFKDTDKKNEIYKMAMGMKKSYEKNKGFSSDQANWIWKTSKALFK
jgi:hypothetical protein